MTKKGADEQGPRDDGRSDSSELLEIELTLIEQKYKSTRENVNRLRVEYEEEKEKSKMIQMESIQFAEYISKKSSKRLSQIITINDDQQHRINALDEDEKRAQIAHEEQIKKIEKEIRAEEFRQNKLKDLLNQESEAMRLKEKHDKKILDLENEFKRRQVEDAEALQELKNECLEAKKNFKMAAQESAKEAQLKLNMEARKMVLKRTETARKVNNDLRKNLVELVDEGKGLALQKRSVEEQQRKVKAELQYLKNVKKRI